MALGPQAFSKWRTDGDGVKKMSNFNAAVFDAVAVGLAQVYSITELMTEGDRVAAKLQEYQKSLFSKQVFFEAVSGSVNDSGKVTTRIKEFSEFIKS
jgi:hypothetical protein